MNVSAPERRPRGGGGKPPTLTIRIRARGWGSRLGSTGGASGTLGTVAGPSLAQVGRGRSDPPDLSIIITRLIANPYRRPYEPMRSPWGHAGSGDGVIHAGDTTCGTGPRAARPTGDTRVTHARGRPRVTQGPRYKTVMAGRPRPHMGAVAVGLGLVARGHARTQGSHDGRETQAGTLAKGVRCAPARPREGLARPAVTVRGYRSRDA